jgi:hypothetical protein
MGDIPIVRQTPLLIENILLKLRFKLFVDVDPAIRILSGRKTFCYMQANY